TRLLSAGVVLTLGLISLVACSNSAAPNPNASVEMPTASYTPPADAQVTPPEQVTLANVQPNDGIGPVVEFIDSAKTSVDISIYRIDSDFTAVVDAMARAVDRGVSVRLSISRQLVGEPNPPEGNAQQIQVAQDLRQRGIQVELSRPEFHYGHEKTIVVDAGTPGGVAMIADWNLQESYFGPNQYGPVGSRGMAVFDRDPQDVATIAAYFDANWPPYAPYPESTRASLVWSPSGIEYRPVGNSVQVLTDFVQDAKQTLDIYAEYIQDDAFLVPMVEERAKAGVRVRMIANSDGQSPEMVSRLRAAGVEIRFDPIYDDITSDPMFVHTKTMFSDVATSDARAFFGSQNTFINESPEAILELGIIVTGKNLIDEAYSFFDLDWSTASEMQASPSPSGD
ncbi:MAG: phospholipase D-like domain-containing protein, partial [Candidatus Nanopelagicales bacterium]